MDNNESLIIVYCNDLVESCYYGQNTQTAYIGRINKHQLLISQVFWKLWLWVNIVVRYLT